MRNSSIAGRPESEEEEEFGFGFALEGKRGTPRRSASQGTGPTVMTLPPPVSFEELKLDDLHSAAGSAAARLASASDSCVLTGGAPLPNASSSPASESRREGSASEGSSSTSCWTFVRSVCAAR